MYYNVLLKETEQKL